jgi:hypothetical protein
MQFVSTRLARIEGTVTGLPPDNRGVDPIMLLSADDIGNEIADSTRPDLQGRFRFPNISPGRYKLFLRTDTNGPSHSPRMSAAADLVVADKDINNLVLDLRPGVTVAGHVVFRGSSQQPPAALMERAGLEIRLDPVPPGPFMHWLIPSTARLDATAEFVVHDVFPGDYRISASQKASSGWFLDTTEVPGPEATGQVVQVRQHDVTGITVTMTDQRAEITGTIMTQKGEPAPEYFILIYPSDETYWTPYSLRLRGARAKQDGTFVIDGIPEGSYRLATLLDAEFGAWFEPSFLRRIDPASMALSIANHERRVLNLRVPGDR